ncbi:MAG: autotransporter assembly complex family protein [Rudaea sp.]|uniref:autotransporter assembly complex protein TamA n=1 Tax=Rudaea sp. TaxID=2136325 RepID=UPI0039E397F1
MNRRALQHLIALFAALVSATAQAGTITTQIDGVDDPLKAAVAAAAEITQYEKQDVSAAQAQRLYKNAGEQIVKALEAYGYYNAKTDGELKETAQGWNAIIHVRPGERLAVGDYTVEVPSPAREEKEVAVALANFTPKAGQPFDSTAYEKSKAAVQSALFSVGYLDAKQTVHKVEVSRSANRAAIALKWDVGERYRFGDVIFKGSQLNDGVLDRYIPWRKGDFYSQTRLLRLQQKLVDADYFAIVDVQPDKDKAQGNEIPIDVTLAPAPRNIYTAGVFVDSDIGPGVKGSITRRWVNGRGHKAKIEAEIAQREKMLAGTYTIPLPGDNNRAYNFGVAYRDIDTETVQSDTLRLTANETRYWHGWNRTIGVNALSGTYTVANIDGSSTVVYPEFSLTRKKMDDSAFVRNGYSLSLDATASPGPSTRFASARADATWIRAFGDWQRLVVRGSLGAMEVGDFDKLPPELRFFAGGDRSIRGYAYQTIGPPLPADLLPIALARCASGRSGTDCNNLIIGGTDLAVGSIEYQYFVTPTIGVSTFVDAGDAFSGFGNYKTHLGTGLGVLWKSPVGMVRAYLGVPVNDPENRHGVQLHLIIGPDL